MLHNLSLHCCLPTNPINLHHYHSSHHHPHRPSNTQIRSTKIFIPTIHQHQNYNHNHQKQHLDNVYNENLTDPRPEFENKQHPDRQNCELSPGIFTNMWWANLKAAVGQRINVSGILFSLFVIIKNKHWVIPHVSVPDIRSIDWAALKKQGFEGVVFDKDNTLTVPYSLDLWGPLTASLESCKSVFGDNIAVFSNSAGLQEYDPDGRKARALEFAIGIRVIRHKMKKPGGSVEEVERHFGCDSSKLIMVGDRPFTDIVYGNKNGFLTILTAPFSLAEETFIVKQVRKIELALLNWWLKKGLKPANARLFPDALDCVNELI